MKTKYIISLGVLVTFTSPSCQGAASNSYWQLCKSFAGQCSSLFQQLTSTLKDGDPREISHLLEDMPALTDMPAETIEQIVSQLNSSYLMLLAETNSTFYQVIKNMPSFQNLKQLIERHNGNLVAALNDAVENDNTWPISYLIRRLNDNPATANIVNNTLMNAIHHNYINKVNNLLQGGANPNASDQWGTALGMATYKNNSEIVKLLLEHGAHVDTDLKYGWTALGWAARDKHIKIMDILIAAGADVEKTMEALERFNTPGAIDLLKQRSANGPILNFNDDTLMKAIHRNHTNKVTKLLQGGANPNASDQWGTALGMATYKNNTEIVKLLLEHGAHVDTDLKYGWTALGWAARDNHIKIMDILIAAGADVEKTIEVLRRLNMTEAIDLLNQRNAQYRQKHHQTVTAMETTE